MDIVKQVEPDVPVFPAVDTSKVWFGVKKAQADFGFDGNADGLPTYSKDDLVIAIVDTGVDLGHIDLYGGKVIAFHDSVNSLTSPYDEASDCDYHGTHVSSIAAGAGDGDPTLAGVAPGAALVVVKALVNKLVNVEIICTADLSQIVAGVQWVIDNRATYGINVMNMSLTDNQFCADGTSSLSAIADAAVGIGITTVVAAGNLGHLARCTIGNPAASEKAITVGSFAGVEALPASTASPGMGFYRSRSSGSAPPATARYPYAGLSRM